MTPGTEIYVEVPKTGGTDTAVLVAAEDDQLVVTLWGEVRRIPRSWVFDPVAVNADRWHVRIYMAPMYDGDDGATSQFFESQTLARSQGLHAATWRGTRSVDVFSPSGVWVYAYDRADNLWRTLREDD